MLGRSLLLVASCFWMVACGPSARYTHTGQRHQPKEEDCPIQVFTALPSPEYAEIGVIDVNQFPPTDIQRFKKMATPHVCKAGGDAVLAFANGNGLYIKGTVLKRVAIYGPAQPPPPVVVAPPVPGEGGGPGGCQYDTQCKGDRVCVDGKCIEPSGSAQPPAP